MLFILLACTSSQMKPKTHSLASRPVRGSETGGKGLGQAPSKVFQDPNTWHGLEIGPR